MESSNSAQAQEQGNPPIAIPPPLPQEAMKKAKPENQPTQPDQVSEQVPQESEKQKEEEVNEFVLELKQLQADSSKFTQQNQLNRLLSDDFLNPFDVFDLPQEANDHEIKKRFRMLSLFVHPDKCSHEKAADAFHTLEQAYKQLLDPDKRRMYQRVMREARDRVMVIRRKENLRRVAKGLDELTEDSIKLEIDTMCTQLFKEIEEKRDYLQRMDTAYKRKRTAEVMKEKAKEEVEKDDLKAWEEGRERRVASWRDFSMRKERTEKRKRMKFGVHAPQNVAEERGPNQVEKQVRAGPDDDIGVSGRPMGIQTDYKKYWR